MNNLTTIKESSEFLELRDNIQLAIDESKKVVVFDEAQVNKAGFYIKKFKELEKKLESYRKEIVQPLNDEVKDINSFFKKISVIFNPEQERLTKETNEVLKEIRRKQEEERIKEQKELEDAILDEAEMFDDISILDKIPQVEIKQQSLGQKTDNLTSVRKKVWHLIDIDKVPKEYLMVNEKLIDQIRKDYDFEVKEQPINGIKFHFEETVRIK